MTGEGPATNSIDMDDLRSRLAVEERNGSDVSESEAPPKYRANIYTAPSPTITPELALTVQALEKSLGMQVWLLVQDGSGRYGDLDEPVRSALFAAKDKLPKNQKIALIIDSPGGIAKAAYQIAKYLERYCGGFVAVVPRYAKSAATLLTLGADSILLGDYAELGPLDVQLYDPERERYGSALDESQALERMHAFALQAFDETMWLLSNRTRKKTDFLVPAALKFAVDMTHPLLENLDTVHYTQVSRVLKVAEEYATRLLSPRYPDEIAESIARHLVENYPEHDFVIDAEEAAAFGLRTDKPNEIQAEILDLLVPQLAGLTAIGRLEEVEDERG